MKMKFLFLLTILTSAISYGQVIKGKVTDKDGITLPGVNVKSSNSNTSATSDFDGAFVIKANAGDELVFTYIGMQTQTLPASNDMTVVMQAENTKLEEVVVIGYGTAKKRDLTGSITKIDGKQVFDKPNTNAIASIQGKVAGLSVVNTGKIGEDPDVRLRGTSSLYNTKPLYVVDGLFTDNINFLNPNDIENMEVLKDGSSLAIFGVRGTNGVIIVTTKKAKSGKTIINYNTYVGVKTITGKPSLTNAEEFKTLYNEQLVNQGAAPYTYYNLFNGNTDWIDEISNNNAVTTSNNLSIMNGTENNKFSMGIGYLTDEGLVINEKYKRVTMNLNDELQVSKKIKVGVSLNGSDARLPQRGNFEGALRATPIVTTFNTQHGLYNQLPVAMGAAQLGNPLLEVEAKKFTQLSRETRFLGNVFAEIEILKDLKFKATYFADLQYNNERGYNPVFNVYAAEIDAETLYGTQALTSVYQRDAKKENIQQDVLLTYKKTFGKHDFTLLAGNTRSETSYTKSGVKAFQYQTGDAIPNDKRWWYVNAFPYVDPNSLVLDGGEQWDTSTISYLGRMLYSFDGKYILNASFRRDGSSELRKFQNFWALGAAWDITKENFMSNQKTLDLLKVKASYAVLGNPYTSIHYPTYPNYTTGASAVFGNSLVPAYILAYRPNTDLEWEKVTSTEFGIETASLNNRLKFEASYYQKKTENLLTFVTLGAEKFYTNAGEIENKGLELTASWNDRINDNFSYGFGGNLATIKNEVKSIYLDGFQVVDGASISRAGSPIGSFYGYEVEGVYQSYADILNSPPSTIGSYGPGDLKYKDINGDGKITPDDRTIIGNPTPDFTYGVNANVAYKNLSLSVDVQGVYGNEVYREWGNGSTFTQFNYRTERLDRWTGAGTSNWEPRVNGASNYNDEASTYKIEDGSYTRLRNIQLSYNLNTKFLQKMNIQNVKIYVNAQNLVTWKNTSGFTPEAGGTPTRFGVDNGGYPLPAITSFGLNVTF